METAKEKIRRLAIAEIDKLDAKDRPYLSNYPVLEAWINALGARCLSQEPVGTTFFEKWTVRGFVILIEVRSHRNGWEVWTTADTNDALETFRDAEERIEMMDRTAWLFHFFEDEGGKFVHAQRSTLAEIQQLTAIAGRSARLMDPRGEVELGVVHPDGRISLSTPRSLAR